MKSAINYRFCLHKKHGGFILLSVILLTAVSSLMVVGGFEKLLQHTKAAANLESYYSCFYQADRAAMHARKLLATTPAASFSPATINYDGAKITIVMDSGLPKFTVSCSGNLQKIEITVTETADKIIPLWLRR